MQQTITIEIPEGKVAKQITNPDGSVSIIFVDKEPIRSKSWEEFCKNHPNTKYEWYISSTGSINENLYNYLRNKEECNNHLETKEDAEGILALIQLTRLHDEWVGDWKPDYSTRDEVKYQIKFPLNKINVVCHYSESALLDFQTRETAEEFLECFKDLIIKAKRFI